MCYPPVVPLRLMGALPWLDPVSGRKVNSWGSPSPEQAEGVLGLQGGGVVLLFHVRWLGWTVVDQKAVSEAAVLFVCDVPAQCHAVCLLAGLNFPFTPLNASGEAWTPGSLLLHLLKTSGNCLE